MEAMENQCYIKKQLFDNANQEKERTILKLRATSKMLYTYFNVLLDISGKIEKQTKNMYYIKSQEEDKIKDFLKFQKEYENHQA